YGEIRASEPVPHRDMPGRDIQDHFGDKEGVETGSPITLGKTDHLVLEADQAAYAAGKNHAHPVRVCLLLVDCGIPNSLVAGGYCDLGITVHLTGLFLVQVL